MNEPTNGSQQHIVVKSTEFINVNAFKQLLYTVLHGAPRLNIFVHAAVIQAAKTELTWHAPLHHICILYTFGCNEYFSPNALE